jgi:HNH endonuclease
VHSAADGDKADALRILDTIRSDEMRDWFDEHGVIHAFKLVADHVVPHKLGGKTDIDNLVTACPACNYGKECYTLDQLGLEDPRDRDPKLGDWDGLTAFIPGLKTNPLITTFDSAASI